MDRRDVLRGALTLGTAGSITLGGIAAGAAGLLAPLAQAVEAAGPDSEAERAMGELLAAIGELDAGFAKPEWRLRTAQDFAEARRLLMHTLLHALQAWFEADPERPFFRPFIDSHKKLLGDNPDARYHSAAIEGGRRYRIFGNLAGATYTSFTVELGVGDESSGVGSTLNDTQFETDAEGNYEIILSPTREGANWMQLPADAASITARHYYERQVSVGNDPLHRIPIAIENLDATGPQPAPSDASIATGIRRVEEFMRRNLLRLDESSSPAWVSRVPNRFPPPQQDDSNRNIAYAAVDNVYLMAPFLLQPNQALVMRGRFPPARFANVVLWNRFMQTLDYDTRTVSLNREQVKYDPDGSFRIVIAHRDPGAPNWLDTEGRAFGLVFWRFLLPEAPVPPVETELITL